MKLLTKPIEKKLRANSAAQDGSKSFNAVVKFFDPTGQSKWYLSELDDNNIAFGVCDLGMGMPELGYVTLAELKSIKGAFGLGIERDKYFDSNKYGLLDILKRLKKGDNLI